MSNSSLELLPVEIFHHIFDYLDIETILFSFRYVCKRFYSITQSYNSYQLNFQSISKTKFYLIFQLIPFEQIISVTLSNQDKTHGQIQLFLSLFNLNQFFRLRSLTLLQIEDIQLNIFLNSIHHSSLISLCIDSKTMNIRKNTSLKLLSSVIEHHTLEKLDLHMWSKDINELQWPINNTITYLRIRNSITLNYYFLILQNSPCLKTIILKDFNIDEVFSNSGKFSQVKSFTCKDGRIEINKLKQALLLTPEIEYLTLIGNGNILDSSFHGYSLEKFIKQNLFLLKKFQFFISVLTHVHFNKDIIKNLISYFRTPFWLYNKECFVQYDYIIDIHKLILYTIPICINSFEYYSNFDKTSISNSSKENQMDKINQLNVNLTRIMNQNKRENFNQPLFRNIAQLKLEIDGIWPKGSYRFLSTTIDLLRIRELFLSINFFHEYMSSIVFNINKLLQYAINIHTLIISDYCGPDNCTTNMEIVSSMINSNIKHLQIRVKNSDDIKYIIENCKYLKSITFEYAQSLIFNRDVFLNCLSDMKRHSSKWECQNCVHVWLDNN